MTFSLALASPSPAGERAAHLAACEHRIVESQRAFMAALYDIYSQQLWADTDASFEGYLVRRWGYKERYCRYLRGAMDSITSVRAVLDRWSAVEVEVPLPGRPEDEDDDAQPVMLSAVWDTAFVEDGDPSVVDAAHSGTGVPDVPDITSAPESVIRPLVKLVTPQQKAEAWVRACERAGLQVPTAAQVVAVVAEMQAEAQQEADLRRLTHHAESLPHRYGYVKAAFDAGRLTAADGVLLCIQIDACDEPLQSAVVNAQLTDFALLRELRKRHGDVRDRRTSGDTFFEIIQTGGLALHGGFVPLERATAEQVIRLYQERADLHRQLAIEGAHDLIAFKGDVMRIGTVAAACATTRTALVPVTMWVPADVAARLIENTRYGFQVDVPKRNAAR